MMLFRVLLILVVLAGLCPRHSVACSCSGPLNFCETLLDNNPDLTALAVKKAHSAHGMQVEILEVLQGAESRQQVMVWGDNGFLCRHYVSQWSVGDTVIFSLHRIGQFPALQQEDSTDYYLSVCGTYFLDYAGGQVSGVINGTDTMMSYPSFKNALASCAPSAINCNSFSVTEIQIDSTNTILEITVFADADSSVFINYPFVSLVINNNGDTLATGTMNSFGQYGGTSQTYYVSSIKDSLPENFSGIVYFHYDTSVCVLTYTATSAEIRKNYSPEFFPNPSDGIFMLKFGELQNYLLEVYNAGGKNIFTTSLATTQSKIDLTAFSSGLYFVKITDGTKVYSKKIIVR